MQDLLNGKPYSRFRRGIGKDSLCEDCNKRTGGWYGTAFADWSKQGMEWFEKVGGQASIDLPFYTRPLNVIKQIMVMALALSAEQTLNYHYELRRFILNKDQRYLPPKYRVHAYFNMNGQPRFVSGMAIMKIDSGHGSYVEAEVALPPFGYCISTSLRQTKSLPDYHQLYDITWFARYDYDEWSPVYLRLPVRETHEPLPLDYRSKAEIDEHYKEQADKEQSKH